MGPHAQCLLHPEATAGTILRGEARRDSYHWDTMQCPIVADPAEEPIPARITDGLGKVTVLDEVGHLQVFKGNQVVRRDERTGSLCCEVFTLPLDFEVALRQSFDGLLAILGTLLLARDAPIQPREFLLRFAQVAWVGDGGAFGVRREGFEAHIDADLCAGRDVYNLAVCLHRELAVGSHPPASRGARA